MVDLEVLTARGITKKSLAAKLSVKEPEGKIKQLTELLQEEMRIGLEKNWREARVWKAIDDAYDAPMDQTKWSFVQNLSKKKLNAQALTEELMDFGLQKLMRKHCDLCDVPVTSAGTCSTGCTCTTRTERMDLPAFFDVVVGLVPAYVKMRWAKIFNDRDLIPHYRYDPLKLTQSSKTKADIMTDRVDMMATQLDYRSDRRQKIFQTLLYGQCLQCVQEEWYKEVQLYMEDGEEKEWIVKEGIRNFFPHPSKYFFDESFRLSSLNTNSGTRYFGHWYVTTYGAIKREPGFFNLDVIKFGSPEWMKSLESYANYYPCTLNWPKPGEWGKRNDREANFVYYGQRAGETDENYSIILVNLFHQLIPKDWGLGDYDKPVWFRFVMASHDTAVYCAPLPYTPGTAYLYDFDGNRARNASMATEVAPFQSIISNYFSQLLFSVHQNLTRVVGYNRDLIDEATIQKMQGLNGERLFRGIHYMPFSGRENTWGQKDITQAFYTPNFPQHNVSEIIQGIQTAINILERVLQFSSQELGVAASHEQSATESTIIHQNMGDRLKFSSSFVDDGEYSDKRRLYEAIMAYSDDEIFAQIAEMNDATRQVLDDMDWKVEEEATPGRTKAGIRGSKKSLRLEDWAATRESADRINMSQIGNAMVQLVMGIVANPIVLQSLGPQQVIDIFNQAFTFLGLPKDFRLHVAAQATMEQQSADLQKQVAIIAQKVSADQIGQFSKVIGEKVIQPMQKGLGMLLQKTIESEKKDEIQDVALHEIANQLNALSQQGPGMMPSPPVPMAPEQGMLPPPPIPMPPPGLPPGPLPPPPEQMGAPPPMP